MIFESLLVALVLKETFVPHALALGRLGAAVALILTLLQVGLESPRWQMAPLYFAIASLLFRDHSFAFSLRLICLLLYFALVTLMPIPALPPPTGSHRIGMRSFSLRTTPFEGMHPKRRVDLRMNVWYPADVTNLDKNMDWSEYMEPEHAVKILPVGLNPRIPGFFASHFVYTMTQSIRDLPFVQSTHLFPLIIFSPGLKGFPELYTSYAEDLASRGFVVASLCHSDGSPLIDFDSYELTAKSFGVAEFDFYNRQVNIRAKDVSEALNFIRESAKTGDPVFSKTDFTRVACVGHSFGGGTSLKAMIEDSRIKAVVGTDSWLFSLNEADKAKQRGKVLLISSSEWQIAANKARIAQVIANSAPGSLELVVKHTEHQNFVDTAFHASAWLLRSLNVIGEADRLLVHQLTLDLMATYLVDVLELDSNSMKRTLTFSDAMKKYSEYVYVRERAQ